MLRAVLTAALLAAPLPALSNELNFGDGWKVQPLTLFSNNRWSLARSGLGVESDDSVSLVWRRLDQAHWSARQAQWSWEVSETVAATDLTRKGGDDRNFSMYFFFLPQSDAQALGNADISDLQGNANGRVLTYVWGGNYGRGQVIGSPWLGAQGTAVALRPAGTGAFTETVNLGSDYRAAFGSEPMALVGVAVSSDSDDTGGRIVGRVSGLIIR